MGTRHAEDAVKVAAANLDIVSTHCGPAEPEWSDGSTAELLPAIPMASEAATATVEAETVAAPIVATPPASSSGPTKALASGVGIVATSAELGG